jgi:hypothetical protein
MAHSLLHMLLLVFFLYVSKSNDYSVIRMDVLTWINDLSYR